MGPRRWAAVGVCMVFAVFAIATPTPVSACSSDSPSFREAVTGARAIARVTIVEGFDGVVVDPTNTETFLVDRVFKGSLPRRVTLSPAWTSLCHDTVAQYARGAGRAFVLAVDVRYYGEVIHPLWAYLPAQGAVGTAGSPPRVRTLADLESAIVAELRMPDTATATTESTPAHVPATLLLVVGFVAFAAALVGIRSRN